MEFLFGYTFSVYFFNRFGGILTTLPVGYRNNHCAFANIGFFWLLGGPLQNMTAAWCRTMECTGTECYSESSVEEE